MSSAPYGSASILPITWAYIRMMGAPGLRAASLVAITSANYIARRLDEYYPVLYTGENGMVAHECILDLRPITKSTGVTVDDVAKRLADYGFHAPTMSFPVAGTLMVEPTESESLAEIDAFCDAMIAIRGEIDRVGAGEWPVDDNPLRGAPHTAECLVVDKWEHPYTREQAAYPLGRDVPAQGVAAGAPHRQRLRRPQPGLLLPAGGGLRLTLGRKTLAQRGEDLLRHGVHQLGDQAADRATLTLARSPRPRSPSRPPTVRLGQVAQVGQVYRKAREAQVVEQ